MTTHDNYIFHVHTWRCGHAEDVPDEAYVIRAIELGADEISFTDHAPFPGNPFQNRMNYEHNSLRDNEIAARIQAQIPECDTREMTHEERVTAAISKFGIDPDDEPFSDVEEEDAQFS